MAGKFELRKTESGQFRFNLHASNGQVILSSQGYTSKDGALNGIESIRKNCLDDNCFERNTAKDGSPYFNLKSTNGQIIGTSEMYSATAGMENGISSVKTNAPEANLVDTTG